MCDINSSIGYNLSVPFSGSGELFITILYINPCCKYEDIIGSGEQHRTEHPIHNDSTPYMETQLILFLLITK